MGKLQMSIALFAPGSSKNLVIGNSHQAVHSFFHSPPSCIHTVSNSKAVFVVMNFILTP